MVVYPRWRGELIYSKPSECIPGGLSPLARGTRRLPPAQPWIFRFIPAGAGNSGSLTQRLSALTVYPRWRGELRAAAPQKCHSPVYPRWRGELAYRLVIAPPQLGLSPLARGTQYAFNHCQAYFRFIPAGAGNSVARWTLPDHQPVYPRWRGELCKHNLLLINDFLSQSQSTNFTVSHKQHIHYVKEHLIH